MKTVIYLSILISFAFTCTCQQDKAKYKTCRYRVYQNGLEVDVIDRFEKGCKSRSENGVYLKQITNRFDK